MVESQRTAKTFVGHTYSVMSANEQASAEAPASRDPLRYAFRGTASEMSR